MAEVDRSTSAQTLHTEFAFVLPRGYVDETGTVHREGVMRLATARDEILPQRDPRVRENEAYLTVLLLSRVVTRLGSVPQVTSGTISTQGGSLARGGRAAAGARSGDPPRLAGAAADSATDRRASTHGAQRTFQRRPGDPSRPIGQRRHDGSSGQRRGPGRDRPGARPAVHPQ